MRQVLYGLGCHVSRDMRKLSVVILGINAPRTSCLRTSRIEQIEHSRDEFGEGNVVAYGYRAQFCDFTRKAASGVTAGEVVRNVLLHKRGIADSRFPEGCPWTTVKIGAAMIPDEQSGKQYTDSVLDYAELLLGKINRYFTSKPGKSGTGSAT